VKKYFNLGAGFYISQKMTSSLQNGEENIMILKLGN
jgi:hypothetical protein